jgi:hypothetical protein
MLRGDDPRERHIPRRLGGHPPRTGHPLGSWCFRNKILVEVAALDVLSALTRPFQGDPGIFP